MATYPSVTQTARSRMDIADDIRQERATNGTIRARAMWDTEKRAWSVDHVATAAEAETLRQFYADNRTVTFDFIWRGDLQTYTAMFAGPPRFEPIDSRALWRVTVEIVEA
jgi:hypothetical protein